MKASRGADEAGKGGGYARSTLKHGSIYLVGIVLSRLAGFIMLPVYTRVLSPQDYGVMEVLGNSTDIITFLVGLGIGTAVMRSYYRYESVADRNSVISTAAALLLMLFIVVGLPLAVFAGPVTEVLLGVGQPPVYVRLSALSLVLGVTIEIPMIVLRARQNSVAVVTAGLSRLLLALSLNLLLVVVLDMGVLGVLLSTAASTGCVGGVLFYRLLKETGFSISSIFARDLIKLGAPLVVWEIGSFVLHFSDRFFLRAYDSLAALGLYALSYKLAMLIPFFASGPFGSIWLPKALEIEKQEGLNAIPIMASIQHHYNLLLISASLGLAIFAEDAMRVVAGKNFQAAADPVPVLALAMVFFGYRQMAQIGAIIKERTGLVAKSTASAAAIALLLNALLIPSYGIMGAAFATLGGFFFEFLVMRRYSMRVFPLPVEFGATKLLVAVAAWAVAQAIRPADASVVVGISISSMVFLGYLIALVATGIVTPAERAFLMGVLRRPISSLRALPRG